MIIAGQSKGGAESTYAAAMNKSKLEGRDFRVLATNADALFKGSLFADIVSNNAGISPDDKYFNNFEQVRVVSNSGDKEVVSAINSNFSDAIYLGNIREIKIPPNDRNPQLASPLVWVADQTYTRIENHGAENAEKAFLYTISQNLLPDENLTDIRSKLNRKQEQNKPTHSNQNSLSS